MSWPNDFPWILIHQHNVRGVFTAEARKVTPWGMVLPRKYGFAGIRQEEETWTPAPTANTGIAG